VTQDNSIYECEFKYPISGRNYDKILEGLIIGVIHDDKGDVQPFDIYARSAPMNGVVTFYARHIVYRLGRIILKPFNATTITDVMAQIPVHAMSDCPFEFWTDKQVTADFNLKYPKAIKDVLRGSEGSLVDTFGPGEYEFDKFTVKLYNQKGTDSNVEIRYGKNLLDITKDYDESEVYTAVVPFWYNEEANRCVMLSGDGMVKLNDIDPGADVEIQAVPMDLSNDFEEAPTETQLRTLASNRFSRSQAWVPSNTIDVDFVALWQTPEYQNVSPLQRLSLYDTASIYHAQLGVVAVKMKVVKVVYDVLLERYSRITLGKTKASYGEVVSAQIDSGFDEIRTEIAQKPNKTDLQRAIEAATNILNGGLGGYKYEVVDDDGRPIETLYMDTDDITTAVNILRINSAGIGFSTTGYNGPYTTAWTIDGHFNADFITAGTMSANLIRGGVLQLGSTNNDSGVLEAYDASNNLVIRADNNGLRVYGLEGSYVLMNASEGFAGYDSNGDKLYWASEQNFHMAHAQVENELTLSEILRFIPITTTNNKGIGLVPYIGES